VEETSTGGNGKAELLTAYLWKKGNTHILIVEPSSLHSMGRLPSPTLEDDIRNEFVGDCYGLSVEEHVSLLIYERWLDCMACLKMTEATSSVLWELTIAVDYNIEQTRYMRRQDWDMCFEDEEDAWNNIISMIKHRETLKMLEQQDK
jgi:hypothetical protein